jgi:hypothetical protein
MANKYLAGQSLLIIEALLSYSDTPQSVGILWTRDRLVAQTSTCQQTTLTRDGTSMSQAGFETKIPANERPQTQALNREAIGIGYVLTITLATTCYCKNRTFRNLALLMHKERRIILQPASQMKIIVVIKLIIIINIKDWTL